jgi:putative Mg2+ transporter-C (MgtC) family protein
MLGTDMALWLDDGLRIGMAMLAGVVIGINRDFHHKPIGLRTLGLVAVTTCMLVLTVSQYAQLHGYNSSDAASRVAQGIVAGIGFLGAGVILRPNQTQVLGLTTAAAILVVAAMGIASALAAWPVLLLGVGAALFLLAICGPIENAILRAVEQRGGGDSSG